MKRILHLIKGLGRGGAEHLVVSAVRHGDADRFAYEVAYLLPHKDALVPDLEKLTVPVNCLDGARGAGWIRRLRHLIREHEIDLVHVHSPLPAIGARIALRGLSHLVYTEHNMWPRYRRATYVGNLLTYPLNEHVFAVSDKVRVSARRPRALWFLRMPPIETLYHGPDLGTETKGEHPDGLRGELQLPDEARLVGTVANLKTHKGHRHLFRAALAVRRVVPDVRFVLVGQGPLEDELKREVRELGLDDTVVFAGFREDVPSLLGSFDLFVLPSLQEGLPIALVEAMAAGKPIVATNVGGIPEVVDDGVQGILVPPADPAALSDAIITALGDESLRKRSGDAARRRAQDFDISAAVRRMEQVYEEVLR